MAITIQNDSIINNGDGTVTVKVTSSNGTTNTYTEGCISSNEELVTLLCLAWGGRKILASGISNVIKTLNNGARNGIKFLSTEASTIGDATTSWLNNLFVKLSIKPTTATRKEILSTMEESATETAQAFKSEIADSTNLTPAEKLLKQQDIDNEFNKIQKNIDDIQKALGNEENLGLGKMLDTNKNPWGLLGLGFGLLFPGLFHSAEAM
ncbi:MAG: hypothetical protein PHC64_09800, partial [Candidatus Gastranaerophilales bacterium]|nr:hypothetical protein [Candidatus Gastranaerophilales bacterium]